MLIEKFYRGGITLLHTPCQNFASLFVVRFFLGVAEASIVPAFLLSMSMFFTYDEQAVMMPIMWSIGNASPITSGLLSYGVLWSDTGNFAPWKWFMGKLRSLKCLGNPVIEIESSDYRTSDNYIRGSCLASLSR